MYIYLSAGYYLVLNRLIASRLRLDEIVRGLMHDNCILIILSMCSMNPKTAVTCSHGHFNHVVFTLLYLQNISLMYVAH